MLIEGYIGSISSASQHLSSFENKGLGLQVSFQLHHYRRERVIAYPSNKNMPTKITSFRRYLIPSALALQFLIISLFFVSFFNIHSSANAVQYTTSLGAGSEAAAYPAIIKVNHGKFNLRLMMIDEAFVLDAVKGPYTVKMYGQYTDKGGSDVLVLEKLPGSPIFRPGDARGSDVYSATLTVKTRVLKEFLYALKDIHTKGKISFVYYFRILSQ
jgi:serine/threonine protein kinase